jgi:hypothetical protein
MHHSSRFLLILLMLSAVSHEARATDWWFVPGGHNATGDAMVYVDKSSMRRTRGTGVVTASVWVIFRTEQPSEFGAYRSDKSRMTLDCEKREAGADAGSLLSSFGGVVHRYKRPAPPMAAFLPDSPTDVMAIFMCSDGKQPQRSLPVYDPGRDVDQRFVQLDKERAVPTAPQP